MVRIAGNRHIVIEVQAKAIDERLRCIFLSFVSEFVGTLTKVCIQDTLQAHLPLVGNLLALVLGNSIHIRFQHREELREVIEGITIERARERHGIFGADTIFLHRGKHILCRPSLGKLAVAMEANYLDGTVHIRLVCNK